MTERSLVPGLLAGMITQNYIRKFTQIANNRRSLIFDHAANSTTATEKTCFPYHILHSIKETLLSVRTSELGSYQQASRPPVHASLTFLFRHSPLVLHAQHHSPRPAIALNHTRPHHHNSKSLLLPSATSLLNLSASASETLIQSLWLSSRSAALIASERFIRPIAA